MSFQELLNEEGILFTLFYYLFKVLTWGWIAEILLGLFVSIAFMFLIIIIKTRKMPLFVFKEKYQYTKHYVYLYLLEKFTFIKYNFLQTKYFLQNANSFRFWLIVGIIGVVVTIVLLFGWNFLNEILQRKAEERLNETLINQSFNNS